MTVVINCVGCRPWLHFLAGEQIHQKGESSANAFSKPCILKCGREAIVKPPLLFALHCIRFLDFPRTLIADFIYNNQLQYVAKEMF